MKKLFCVFLVICISLIMFVGCKDKELHLSKGTKSEEAQCVYDYIISLTGTSVLSGQQESTWISEDYEFDYIYEHTGKYPAIRGFDYINDDFAGVNQRAIKWWQKGGIVTICWHTGKNFSGGYNQCKEDVVDNWDDMFTEGTDAYKQMIAGMDKAAVALKELEDAGIPVLWRPFHELYGDWFWWSKGGPDNFKKLWITMYERYTNYWKLDNLIWVLGYSHMNYDWDKDAKGKGAEDWYPGHEYCDIVGADSYAAGKHVVINKRINKLNKGNKPTAYHECGTNPTIEELNKTTWTFFMTWHTTWLTQDNTIDALNALYNDGKIITLDELPRFW